MAKTPYRFGLRVSAVRALWDFGKEGGCQHIKFTTA
jgi:hypothetical protein